MKINELRVGNLLFLESHTQIAEVVEIRRCVLRCKYYRTDTKAQYTSHLDFDRLKPLKISFAILSGFGFRHNSCLQFFKHKSNYVIEYDEDDNKFIFHLVEYGDWLKTVKYVHELQNLYFALTGEELTIATKVR